tara:strand:- start:71 stop:457 length:387 start_codon:yes stop_codon:yes gene_type:complete
MKKAKNFIGRLLISLVFIYAIPGKIINFDRTLEAIINRNIPSSIAPFLLISAILCLFFGSIFFITGFRQNIGIILLLIFLIPTTIIFHFYPFQVNAVLMNTGLIGGLILGIKNYKVNSLKNLFKKQKN